jgi:hypothetical protein
LFFIRHFSTFFFFLLLIEFKNKTFQEEQAVHTYTLCLKDIDQEGSHIAHWKTKPAPRIAIEYWKLKEDATVKDVVRAVRADEADHRDTNHAFADLTADQPNPNH